MNGNVWELPVAKFEQVSLPERPVGQRFSISSLSFKSVRATIVQHLCWCGGSGGLFGRLGCVSSCVWLSVFGWGKSMNWIVRLFPVTKFVRVSSPEWLLRKGFQFHTGFHKSVQQQQRNFVDDVERVACSFVGWMVEFMCLIACFGRSEVRIEVSGCFLWPSLKCIIARVGTEERFSISSNPWNKSASLLMCR